MRVAIVGSRTYPDARRRVLKRLRSLVEDFPHRNIHVVTGLTGAVDTAAVDAARHLGLGFTVHDGRMLHQQELDRVIAFWDFRSRSTREWIRASIAAGVHTEVWDKDNNPAGWQAANATRKVHHA